MTCLAPLERRIDSAVYRSIPVLELKDTHNWDMHNWDMHNWDMHRTFIMRPTSYIRRWLDEVDEFLERMYS